MKIAFWSNGVDPCGVTANLAAVSVATVIRYPYRIIALENHLCQDNLGKAYMGISRAGITGEAGIHYYEGGGIESLLRRIYHGENKSGILKSYIRDIIQEHLYYIPQSRVIHNELFNYEFNHSANHLFHLLEEYADHSFIDTAGFNNLSTRTILEAADLIVVNLCQNQIYLEEFFDNHSSLISKAVFIVGKCTHQSIFNSKRISKLYNIPTELIVEIPYNEHFYNSMMNGSVVEFISRNYSCSKESTNYRFIQSIKKATGLIINSVELIHTNHKEMKTASVSDTII
ncbi:hypothetical protein I5677_06980 [Mobilitalea sibirica]|uniref:Uncharacterized protein n=1 Tax=Mobilitalea sibirica TaxID=1462919 RepID=A0A8J7L2H7_9FIRM|nr:hypothetical protein [Mobilitalea sibirica]MBH1940628.1 hypothetical protein [Mobilitalea sibirica]